MAIEGMMVGRCRPRLIEKKVKNGMNITRKIIRRAVPKAMKEKITRRGRWGCQNDEEKDV